MLPILLIHGYSSEGKNTTAKEIYGKLPALLKKEFGKGNIEELNLSRWISLNDGVSLDDVSFAMDRALKADYAHLLKSGFHVIIHSTGALVVRNWIKQTNLRPNPINNLVHLAGANFGSGLAHIGKGQASRWGRFIFTGNHSGSKVLNELEFGSWKTLDLQLHFLQPDHDMYNDYEIQEFCFNGSQTFAGKLKDVMNVIPIRYVKEDSSDNTVRTSSCNLNFNRIAVTPSAKAEKLSPRTLQQMMQKRESNTPLPYDHYEYNLEGLSTQRTPVPFAVLFETAHFGADIGIVDGIENRSYILPKIKIALETPRDIDAYKAMGKTFSNITKDTLKKAAKLKKNLLNWNRQNQYEGHSQFIFRLKDQFGNDVKNYDITFNSFTDTGNANALEKMIQDKYINSINPGTTTYYLRTMTYENKKWNNLLDDVAPVGIEITAYEPDSADLIAYVPLNIELDGNHLRNALQTFSTTVIDITLMRLPKKEVFAIEASA
jgi:hypothetical protein